MKKLVKILFLLNLMFVLVLTVGCSSDYNVDTVVFDNNTYELCRNNFSVYGDYYKSKGFKCYDFEGSSVFIEDNVVLFEEGLIYHLADDEYPNVSQYDRIEKIKLVNDDISVEIDEEYLMEFSELLCFDKINNEEIAKSDVSGQFWFIEIYYKNYPAYETTYMVVEFDGNIGIMCCETARNTSLFGMDNMYVINGDLKNHIKGLIC